MSSTEQVRAAARALATHDALLAVGEHEPRLDQGGMPIDPGDWLRWHSNKYRPAYTAWSDAMAQLAKACRQPVGRHPATFRPLCEQIIAAS